jgi:hypothetical protein
MAGGSLAVGPDGQVVASGCTAGIGVTRVMVPDDYLSVKVEGVVRPWPALVVSHPQSVYAGITDGGNMDNHLQEPAVSPSNPCSSRACSTISTIPITRYNGPTP